MAILSIIGGNGYRWRGKSIRTIRKDHATCVSMPQRDSMIMAPCSVFGGSKYKITVTASRSNGNGKLIVDLFGGRDYCCTPFSINVKKNQMHDYVAIVSAPNIPKSIPMHIRVWKPNNATGSVLVRSIRYEVFKKSDVIDPNPAPKKAKDLSERKRIEVTKPKPIDASKFLQRRKEEINQKIRAKKNHIQYVPIIKHKAKEDRTMKFRPHKNKKVTEMVKKVFIRRPEDVPKVSIITPTRDGADLLKKCYEALNKNTCYPNWEWIIGDSNSTDGTAELVKGWEDTRVKFVERRTTEGSFSTINNELVAYTSGEYILFLNDDTEPQEFWLYEMMSKIHRHPNIGAVGAKLLYSKDKIQHAGIVFIPDGPANLGKVVLKSFPDGFANHDRFYQAVTGACLLMRKKDFKDINGFDPIYYFCYEDVDLCLKIRYNLNKKVLYAANARLYHKESVTQKRHSTAGEKQQIGIRVFKDRWMSRVRQDFTEYRTNINKEKRKVDVSFVTCVNNMTQYRSYVVGSLFKNKTVKNYEIVPVMNFGNPYSAAQALNIGIDRSRAEIIVLCHQDVMFYEDWVDMLFERIKETETKTKKWGVLGTAGISTKDDTIGVVHNMKGKVQWQSSRRAKVYPVQTVDEHCMIIKKSSKLRFDHITFNGFHLYGPDICLNALSKGFLNFGILCPLIHDSGSGSLVSGRHEFMRLLNLLAKKWRVKFPHIRTSTSVIRKRSVQTFIQFKK